MMTAMGYKFSFQGNKNIQNLIVVMTAQLCKHTESHWIVHFKWVNWMVYELYFNKVIFKNLIFTDIFKILISSFLMEPNDILPSIVVLWHYSATKVSAGNLLLAIFSRKAYLSTVQQKTIYFYDIQTMRTEVLTHLTQKVI